jgi:hypothetical protein
MLRLLLPFAILFLAPSFLYAEKIRVPVDVGVGPAFHMVTGPVQDDQTIHYGLKLSLYAVIDRATLEKQKKRIGKYWKYVKSAQEIRYRPTMFLPDTLYLSPKTERTAMYGASWRPVGLEMPLLRSPIRVAIGAGLLLTYAYIQSDTLMKDAMHFIRPGLDLKAEIELPVTKTVLLSFGWASQLYPPQEIGGEIFAWGELDQSVWHIGQAYAMLHVRFPYTTSF